MQYLRINIILKFIIISSALYIGWNEWISTPSCLSLFALKIILFFISLSLSLSLSYLSLHFFFYANLSRKVFRYSSKLERSEWKVLSFARQSGISTLVSIDKNFTRTPLTASIGFLSPLPT